jgi:hypothetical protein
MRKLLPFNIHNKSDHFSSYNRYLKRDFAKIRITYNYPKTAHLLAQEEILLKSYINRFTEFLK